MGRLRWSAQGRLEVHIDDKSYAHIPVDVGRVTTKKTGKPMKESLIVHVERDKIQKALSKGNKVASIDLGINMLATVTVDDGTVLFYRGSTVKEHYFFFTTSFSEEGRRTRQTRG
ncbi:transposase [Metallosphaera tengchongensis]|uniref:transposase n=1 Tax=Metallosphaera tengchongensis TaxID=1532350 RepID=UPI001FEA5681|nr:transposase [Metallosphaera tengchongensis]